MISFTKFLVELIGATGSAAAFTFGLRAIASTIVLELSETDPDYSKTTSLIIKAMVLFLMAFMLMLEAVKL